MKRSTFCITTVVVYLLGNGLSTCKVGSTKKGQMSGGCPPAQVPEAVKTCLLTLFLFDEQSVDAGTPPTKGVVFARSRWGL